MNFTITISGLIVFSLFGTVFAITPVYYSEEKCDIEKDLKNYQKLLQDDAVVNAFLQKYPDAVSIPSSAIDDSGSQISIQYKHNNGTSKVQLTVQIIGYRQTTHECFVPFSHVLNYSEHGRNLVIVTYENQTQEILDFLKGTQKQSPASILLHSSWSALPVVIDQYRYYIPYKTSGTNIGGMFPNCVIDSLLVSLDSSSDGKITIAMPRYVLDAKDGNNDADYIVILDDEEADFKETETDSQFRILEIQTKKDSRNLEIIATSTTYQVKEPNCGIKKTPQYNVLLTPIQQFKSGIEADEIICKKGMVKLEREENGMSSCVKQTSVIPLLLRNWAALSDITITQGFLDHEIKNATIDSMSFYAAKGCAGGIKITLHATDEGSLAIKIPSKLALMLYSNEEGIVPSHEYVVYVNGIEVPYGETINDDAKTLRIEFNKDAKKIEIIGTCLI